MKFLRLLGSFGLMLIGLVLIASVLFPKFGDTLDNEIDGVMLPANAWLTREVLKDAGGQVFGPASTKGELESVSYQVLTYYDGVPNSDMSWSTEFYVDGDPWVIRANGVWNGPLPSEGTVIEIDSPTGKIEDVVITDDTGKVFVSDGSLSRPASRLFVIRYLDGQTREQLATCWAEAPSRRMAEQGMFCDGYGDELMNQGDIFDLSTGSSLMLEELDQLP